jgi:flagellar hook-basal body complex protein FliE
MPTIPVGPEALGGLLSSLASGGGAGSSPAGPPSAVDALAGGLGQKFGQVLENTMTGKPGGVADVLSQAMANPTGTAQELGNLASNLMNQSAAATGAISPAPSQQPLAMGLGGATGSVDSLVQSLHQAVASRVEAVNGSQKAMEQNVSTMLSGGDVDLHTVILSSERAQLELKLTMQLRNKLIEAYQEVMRTAV